jgi:hypothetical protein
MYLTYNEYVQKGGTLDEPTFENLEYKAEKLLNEFCMEWEKQNIKNLSDDDTMWKTIKQFVFEAVSDDNITSIKNLDLSVTLQTTSDSKAKSDLYDLFVMSFPLEWVSVAHEI